MTVDLLTRFVSEANIQEMSEAQALVALPSFLKGFDKSKNEDEAETVSTKEGGISSRLEAVKYLLRNHSSRQESIQLSAISEQSLKGL